MAALKHPVGRRPAQCGAGLAARRPIGRRGARRGPACRPGRPGPPGGAPGLADQPPSDEAGDGAGRRASRRDWSTNDRWLADAATAAAARNDRGVLEGDRRHEDKGRRRRGRRSRSSTAWPSTGPAAARSIGRRVPGRRCRAATPRSTRRSSRAWPAAGPRTSPRSSTRDRRGALKQLAIELPAGARGQLVRLVGPLGRPGPRRHRRRDRRVAAGVGPGRVARRRRAGSTPRGSSSSSARPTTQAARALLDLITPAHVARAGRRPDRRGRRQRVAAGRHGAGRTSCRSSAPACAPQALRALLGRADWTPALVDGARARARSGSPSWRSTRSRPWPPTPIATIAARAKTLLGAGRRPARPRPAEGHRPARAAARARAATPRAASWSSQQQCAKCHRHSGEGGQVGPDLTGMAAIPATSC